MAPLTYNRRPLSSSAREALYDRCRGDQEFPACNICGLPVDGTRQAWDESHDPEGPPRALGGTETGVAHRDCNRRHGAQVVVPMLAKADRVRQKFIGASISRAAMPCGRASRFKRTIGGRVVPRLSRAEKLASPRKYRQPNALDDLTDALLQGTLDEGQFAEAAAALGAPREEIDDLLRLSRVSAEMAGGR